MTEIREKNVISHLRRDETSPDGWTIQDNETHSRGVAGLARRFGDAFGSAQWCYCAGMLHDKGKEQTDFQSYIRIKSGYDSTAGTARKCPHAFVGALLACQAGLIPLAPVIAGHHAGLPDAVDLSDILQRPLPGDVSAANSMLQPGRPPLGSPGQYSHWVRMVFSCLVDADYLDTEKFMQPHTASARPRRDALSRLLPRLEEYLDSLKSRSRQSHVNDIRAKIQERCRAMAASAPGFYSLTVPTGGGKTLSGLVWAMLHAVNHGKERIIIVIPYTSIILQTASILRDIFGAENVLEHHSEVDFGDDGTDGPETAMRLAAENWDYPIIVTTNVRLFESMFAARPGKCRKLHNICQSVLILDEAQTLPVEFLQPIVDALQVYKDVFGISALFTTASMPAIGRNEDYELKMRQARGRAFRGIPDVTELIPETWELYSRLRRVRIVVDDRVALDAAQVAERMCRHNRVLCIVNTRSHAREIFAALPDDGITLHLSKNMYPRHIRETLDRIYRALKDSGQTVVRVVATQLVEAGVDVDFPYVMREQSGLDSIIQAAGRCNREGRSQMGECTVFSMGTLPPGYMSQCNNARLNMSETDDLQSPAAMRDYFEKLYFHQDFDKHRIGADLNNPQEINFRTAAENFRLIDDSGNVSIVIDCHDTASLIRMVGQGHASQAVFRTLMSYAVGVGQYSRLFRALKDNGQLTELIPGLYSTPEHNYDPRIGLFCNEKIINETIII